MMLWKCSALRWPGSEGDAAIAKLSELARLIRSKNAGPFVLTFDVLLEDDETYRREKRSGELPAERVAELYGIAVQKVDLIEYEAGHAFKATIPRTIPPRDT